MLEENAIIPLMEKLTIQQDIFNMIITEKKMVKAPLIYFGEDSVLMIGGLNSSCTIEEYSNGGWNRKSHCTVGGVVGFRKVFTSDFCQS